MTTSITDRRAPSARVLLGIRRSLAGFPPDEVPSFDPLQAYTFGGPARTAREIIAEIDRRIVEMGRQR